MSLDPDFIYKYEINLSFLFLISLSSFAIDNQGRRFVDTTLIEVLNEVKQFRLEFSSKL